MEASCGDCCIDVDRAECRGKVIDNRQGTYHPRDVTAHIAKCAIIWSFSPFALRPACVHAPSQVVCKR